MTIITLSLTIIFKTQVRCNSLFENSELKPQLQVLECCTNLNENSSSAKKYSIWCDKILISRLHCVCAPLLERKMYQPVEIDNQHALISCGFIHQSGRLFSLMSTISLVLSIIDFWLLNWIASSLRRSCWVTNSSL